MNEAFLMNNRREKFIKPITDEEKRYLRNKHKGGRNNNKGSRYESFYAVYCLAVLMDEYKSQRDMVLLTSQVPDAFVDDLLVIKPTSEKLYSQLKDVKGLTWKAKKLEYDFRRQMELLQREGAYFHLYLVYSDRDSKVLDIPKSISSCTKAVFFPAHESLNQLLLSYSPFRDAISQIAVGGQGVKNDELFGIAGALLGAWNACGQTTVSLAQVVERMQQIGKGYVNVKSAHIVEIPENCKNILKNCGLRFHVDGVKLYWSNANGRLSGSVEWTPDLEQKLLEQAPAELFDVIELLS